jgi:spore germination protein YaaH
MRKGLKFFLWCVILLISLNGCKKDNSGKECIGYSNAQITEIKGSNVTSAGQEIDLTISYFFFNGCGKFESLESITNGNTTTIRVIAKYEGCVCPEVLVKGEKVYSFKASQPGIYLLKFLQPNKSILEYTITVN